MEIPRAGGNGSAKAAGGDAIHVQCTECGMELTVSAASAGRKGRCPRCQAIMPIPHAGQSSTEQRDDTIVVTCQECHAELQVAAECAGKKGRCPNCKAVMSIPALAGKTPAEPSVKSNGPAARTDSAPVMPDSPRRQADVANVKTDRPIVKTEQPRPMVTTTRYVPAMSEEAQPREKRREESKPTKVVDENSLLLLPPGEAPSPPLAPDQRPAAPAAHQTPLPAPPVVTPKKPPPAAAPPPKAVPPQLIKPPVQNAALPPQLAAAPAAGPVDLQPIQPLTPLTPLTPVQPAPAGPLPQVAALPPAATTSPPAASTASPAADPPAAIPRKPPVATAPPPGPTAALPAPAAPVAAKAAPAIVEKKPASASPTAPAPAAVAARSSAQVPAVPSSAPVSAAASPAATAPAPARPTPAPARPAAAAPPAKPSAPAQARPAAAPTLSREQVAAQILSAFSGQIPKTPPSTMYKLGILLTAAVMLLLPLVYIGLILLASAVVLWHMTSNVGLVTAISGRGAILGVIAYLAPAAIGMILVVFMIKPLFAPSGEREKSRTLSRESEPLLFAFVERICATVQAPVPSQINVNCEVNASAGFRSGLASFASHDLALTIGMPLVAGLSLQQLGGVLAHEFGHFSQGTGMRLTYVTRTINHWLMRVVYERDSWDMWLDRITDSLDIRIGWVLYLMRFVIWLTRRVLWLLMLLGHAVSGFMLREMEYDADRYEARLAGSHTFEATVRQLIYLNLANRGAHADLENFYREGRLADNLPRLIIANVAQLPEEARKFADELIEKEETSVFDSHPSDRDRIASAREENAAGVFQSRQPGTILFNDFDGLAKAVTWDFYTEVFGSEFKPTAVRPIEEMLERQSREDQIYDAMKRFLLDTFQVLRPLRVSEWYLRPPANPMDVQNQLAWARNEMYAQVGAYNQAWDWYDKADTRIVQMKQLVPLMRCGASLVPDGFDFVPASAQMAGYERDRAYADMNHLDSQLVPLETAAGQRLYSALWLLHDPQFAARMADARELLDHCQRLMPLVGRINNHLAQINELRSAGAILAALAGHIDNNDKNEALFHEIVEQLQRTQRQLHDLWVIFQREAYPFDHHEGFMSISHFLLKELPRENALGGTLDGIDQLLGNLASLYRRSLARLCYIAERVETTLGWDPLPLPERPKAA